MSIEIMWHCWAKEDLKTDSFIIQYLQSIVSAPSTLSSSLPLLPFGSAPFLPLVRKEQASKREQPNMSKQNIITYHKTITSKGNPTEGKGPHGKAQESETQSFTQSARLLNGKPQHHSEY